MIHKDEDFIYTDDGSLAVTKNKSIGPFKNASSFTIGSTDPTGRFCVTQASLAGKKNELSTTNWLVNFWVREDTLTNYIFAFGDSSVSGLSLNKYDATHWQLKVNNIILNTVPRLEDSTWTMFTLWNDTSSIYIKKNDNIASSIVAVPALNDFYFGTDSAGENATELFISNIYVGLYRNSAGTIIWTDRYIEELYKSKQSFITKQTTVLK